MFSKTPRVSVGMPVYNAERYLAQAIESILSQTFVDFALVISDNGSTDRTEEICRAYVGRDKRIRYVRQAVNRGAAWNYNAVFRLSSGKYFKWHCHDDLCEPTFLEKCVAVLDRKSSVVLCYSQFARIDDQGKLIKASAFGWSPIASSPVSGIGTAHERFRALIHRRNTCEEIYGVMRRAVVEETRLIGSYTQSDDNFLAELALRGEFHEIPEPLLRYRLHVDKSTEAYRSRSQRMAWFDPAATGRLNIPFLRQFQEYLSLIGRAPLAFTDRAHCYVHILVWAWRFRHWLREDLHEIVFLETMVPFLKRFAPWTRPMWHAVKRTMAWWAAKVRRLEVKFRAGVTQ